MSQANHIKSTFKHALIYSGATILGKAIGFIMLPVYAHYLRGEGYGIIGMIDVTLSVLVIFIGYGISGAMRRFYFQKTEGRERNIFVSTNIILMVLLVIGIVIPALIFSEPIARLAFGKVGMGYYIVLAFLNFIAETTAANAANYIIIQRKSLLYSGISLVQLFIALSLNIYLIVYLELGVLGYLYSALITSTIITLVMHGYAFWHVGVHFRNSDAREILAFSLPLIPGYVAAFIRGNTDRVMLRTYLGLTQLGAFEMLFKFATLIGVFFSVPFMRSWDIKRFEICEQTEGPNIMARMFTYQLAVNLFFGMVLALMIPLLLRLLTPPEFWLGGGIALLAVASRIVNDSYTQFNFGLVYAKRMFTLSAIQFIAAGVSVVLCWLLIKDYGIFGAVIAASLVSVVQCLIGYLLARKYYPIPYEWMKVVLMVCSSTILFFMINLISIKGSSFGDWLSINLQSPITTVFQTIHLDNIKEGKLLKYVVNNIPLVFEGGLKFLLSFSFIAILPLIGVVPKDMFSKLRSSG